MIPPEFSSLRVRGVEFRPALFCAPMAEITHSAFRRVLATAYGGCGGFFTEMLNGRAVLHEKPEESPYLRRSSAEPRLIYQLMLAPDDPVEAVVDRLAVLDPDGLDLNLGCHAPMIRRQQSGSRLFADPEGLAAVLRRLRDSWPGLLSVKVRLGSRTSDWRQVFRDRLRLFEDYGVDLITVHLRFFEDRFKRPARHDLLPWVISLTSLPVIANGDIVGPSTVAERRDLFAGAAGLMIGRMAAAQPWIFAAWAGRVSPDYREVWERMVAAVVEDFPAGQAVARIKVFTRFFAHNFRFGHSLAVAVQNAPDLAAIRGAAERFFADDPEPVAALTPTSL